MNQTISNQIIHQLKPIQREVPLPDLYLNHHLRALAHKLGRPLVIANYVTDRSDAIATTSVGGAPVELKSDSDWKLFQELTAQADAIITNTEYVKKRYLALGAAAQNVLTQFDPGGEFADLGDWRLEHGYTSRHPDTILIGRNLDFTIPPELIAERRIVIFTTDAAAASPEARAMEDQGVLVYAAGADGVEGQLMYSRFAELGYSVVKLTTGPRILKILLDAHILDRLYLTRVETDLPAPSEELITVLLGQGLVSDHPDFRLIERYRHEGVRTAAGQLVNQEYLVYATHSREK